MSQAKEQSPMKVMLSKSHVADPELIRDIRQAFSTELRCVTEDDFRPGTAHLPPHTSWTHQFVHTRTAAAMIVLLTGSERDDFGEPNISVGQNVEIFDAIGRGLPVVWFGTTDEGHRIASKWQAIMTRSHPCKVSHQLDARADRQSFINALLGLCREFAKVPKPTLPEAFEPGVAQELQYHVCEPIPGGWRFKDLSERWFEPIIRVRYRDHIISSPYQGLQRSPHHQFDVPLQIIAPEAGLIGGRFIPDSPGVGQLHVQWQRWARSPEDMGSLPWGAELLHWDFSCGGYPLF